MTHYGNDDLALFLAWFKEPNAGKLHTERLQAFDSRAVFCGGWPIVRRLVYDDRTILLLSMDRPDIGQHTAFTLRRAALRAAAETHTPLIPASVDAFLKAAQGKPAQLREVNEKFECVFTVEWGRRNEWFLSGYDDQEKPPLYFLCQLPKPLRKRGDTSLVDLARESLKPASVKRALQRGTAVERQGDIFAIHSSLTEADLRKMGASFYKGAHFRIYGTAHTAPELARLHNNMMLAKGRLIHSPWLLRGGRVEGDHRDRPLGDQMSWWWLTRNTVPIVGKEGR
jgi:hypothetical protein